ncbi:MAG: hypothetical protein ACREC3_10480 [Methyloceanibacter sp.]
MAAVTFGCCLVVAGQSEGLAQGPDYIKLKALLPPAPDAQACYARTYDPEHLQQHPKQKVTELVLFLRYITLSGEDATLISTENGGTEKQYFRYDFTLAAKTKEHDRTLYASGDCASAEGIGCGVECDGGGIEIEPIAGKDDTILVRLERIRMTLGCGEGGEVELEGGEDDKVFKLTKAPRPLCDSMQKNADKPLQ